MNGIYLGRHASGYTPFRYDVTDFVNYGSKNILVVRVDATPGQGWWYEGAGIYRHVWLAKTNPVHIAHHGTFVKSEVGAGSAVLTVVTEIENDSDDEQNCVVGTSIIDSGGHRVGNSTSTAVSLPAGSRQQLRQEIVVNKPALWSIDEASLYKAVVVVEGPSLCDNQRVSPFAGGAAGEA